MKSMYGICAVLLSGGLSGCGGLEIDGGEKKGFAYFEPVPYALAQTNVDCSQSVTAVVLAGERHTVRLKQGFWSSKQSVTFTNGMISSVGAESDNQVPATLSALTSLATAGIFIAKDEKTECEPMAILTQLNGANAVQMPPIVRIAK